MSTKQVELLLSRLKRVKKTGQDKWDAICPAHADSNPSLSIAIGDSGAPILFCRSRQCGAAEILSAVGLDFSDLYPRRPARHGERGPAQYFFPTDVFSDIRILMLTGLLQLKEKNEVGLLDTIAKLESISVVYGAGAHHGGEE